jgi:hypothetical protein
MSLQGRKYAINDVNYHVFDQGKGDRSVLLFAWHADTSGVWRCQVPALLKAGYRVIAPDMVGSANGQAARSGALCRRAHRRRHARAHRNARRREPRSHWP